MLDPTAIQGVEEYAETKELSKENPRDDECMPAPAHWCEQDFDLDATCGIRKKGRAHLIHGSEPRRCLVVGDRGPVSPLSDYGFWDFSNMEWDDDEGDPEWVPMSWVMAKKIIEGESA